MAKNGKIHPAGNQKHGFCAERGKKSESVRMGGMGMEDVVPEFCNQPPDPVAGQQVYLSVHGNGKDLNSRGFCPFFHGRTGLAGQMGGDISLVEPLEKIQELLFPASPGFLSIDMKNFH